MDGSGAESFAWDVNNHGQVALQLPLAGGGKTAAIWQAGVGVTDLGRPPGANAAQANAINDAGTVVGTSGTFGVAGTLAFVWDPAEGLRDLTSLLDPTFGAGWTILEATGISESGLSVGRGYSATLGYRAVLLAPVLEPGTWALMLVGIGLRAAVARSKRGLRDA